MTKLSLIAALTLNLAFAEGTDSVGDTSITGKAQAYYFTNNAGAYEGVNRGMFTSDASDIDLGVTLDVTHKIYEGIVANFEGVGYMNTMNGHSDIGYFGGSKSGAFFNIVNIEASLDDTTFLLGRQLLNTPMISGFDWLIAPGSFEAYTMMNNSIENVTLLASYVAEWRPNNGGNTWVSLEDAGDNWTTGASYDNDVLNASIWYNNIDAGARTFFSTEKYTQVYMDTGYNFGTFALNALYANTDYSTVADSAAFGAKVSASLGSVDLMAAYVNVSDNTVGFVGSLDNLYTSSWNSSTAASIGDNFKVQAATTFSGIAGSISYAQYEYASLGGIDNDNKGSEIDVILAYDFTNSVGLDAIYTNTNYGSTENVDALEVIATYKF